MSDKQILKLTSPIPLSVNHYLGTRAILKKDKTAINILAL